MKKILLIILLFPALSFAQQKYDYKEVGETYFINGKKLSPGDTIRLGVGSGADKNFVYIWKVKKPTVNNLLHQTFLPESHANSILIYKGKIEQGNKIMPSPQPSFYIPGDKEHLYIHHNS